MFITENVEKIGLKTVKSLKADMNFKTQKTLLHLRKIPPRTSATETNPNSNPNSTVNYNANYIKS